MSVNSLFNNTNTAANGATAAAGAASSSGSNNLISESSFMNLMVKELENQDPTNPVSNTDYISELAQFNSMNQLTSMNSTLQSMESSQNEATLGSAVSLVGQTVQATAQTVEATRATGERATRAPEIARVRFREGPSTQLQLDEAEQAANQARRNAAQALELSERSIR